MVKEFKFNCPSCGQHILANEESRGQRLPCLRARRRSSFPRDQHPREGNGRFVAAATPPQESSVPAKTAPPEPPAQAGPGAGRSFNERRGVGGPGAGSNRRPHADVKLDMVRAVRRRLRMRPRGRLAFRRARMFMPQPQGTERRLRSKWRVQNAHSVQPHGSVFSGSCTSAMWPVPAPGRRRLLRPGNSKRHPRGLAARDVGEDREENRDPALEISALSHLTRPVPRRPLMCLSSSILTDEPDGG